MVKNSLERIEKQKKLNAFITVFGDSALEKAKEIDKKIDIGEKVGILAGLPIAIKDNISVNGKRMTCGSKILENFVSQYDATVIEKLLKEDAIIIGKTNLDEFAMGATGEYSYFGATKNPINTHYVAGGSSSGSAVGVASGMVSVSLGSETGGSVRLPASYCGLVGLKPTYGAVSRYGLTAFSSSLDQVGVLSKTCLENRMIFDIIKGIDQNDMTSKVYQKKSLPTPKKMVIGLPKEYFEILDKSIGTEIDALIKKMKSKGFVFKNISIPSTKFAVPTYYVLTTAELSSNLARFDGVRYTSRKNEHSSIMEMIKSSRFDGFGVEVKRRIMLGTYVLSSGYFDAYYGKAIKAKMAFEREFSNVFENDCDIILAPIVNSMPPKIGSVCSDPVQMYKTDVFSCSANIAGIPALSLPIKKLENGFSISVQLMGDKFSENALYELGIAIEKIVKQKSQTFAKLR